MPDKLSSFPAPFAAAVIGASGGIGAALTQAITQSARVARVLAFSRSGEVPIGEKISPARLDIADEASIEASTTMIAGLPLRLVIVAAGVLKDARTQPEKRLADLDAARLAHSFAVNATGPALVAKHFAPLMAREGKAVFAALSARVGSISDNQLGGWHGYRASKAALNMMIRTIAIEHALKRPEQLFVSLHPGTVDTDLSKPFLGGVAKANLFTPAFAANQLLNVIDAATPADSGALIAWDGAKIAY